MDLSIIVDPVAGYRGFFAQLFTFYLPATRTHIAEGWSAAGLLASQAMLLVFC